MKIDVAKGPRSLRSSLRQACQIGTDIAQPGMSDGREQHELCGRHCNSDLAGVEDVQS